MRLLTGKISALGTLCAVLLSCAIQAGAQDFFPIGLFEAGIYPRDSRLSGGGTAEPCRNASAVDDTAFDHPDWSNLDEARGDYLPGDEYGYTSGFNIVQDYFYKYFDDYTFWDVRRYLMAASQRGFKVMLALPNLEAEDLQPPIEERLNFFQRPSAMLQPAKDLIDKFGADPTVHSWYLADEPVDMLAGQSPCNDVSFHGRGIAALKLKAAYDELRAYDDSTHQFVVSFPDYYDVVNHNDPYEGYWGERSLTDYWRWDNDQQHSTTAQFDDPCHSGGPLIFPQFSGHSFDLPSI